MSDNIGFATGNLAIAICDRCHEKYPYSELVADGNTPGLRVCTECSDQKDPFKLPPKKTENVSLKYPRPDISIATPQNTPTFVS